MKKLICFLIFIGILANCLTYASETKVLIQPVQFKLAVDWIDKNINQQIFAVENKTYVPVRAISELLDFDVQWDGETQTIDINTKVKNLTNQSLFYKKTEESFMADVVNYKLRVDSKVVNRPSVQDIGK